MEGTTILDYKFEEWSYITLHNKTYELAKNTNTMEKKPIGYYTDTESEMFKILEYLNYGVKTGITSSMIEQIDKAIRNAASMSLNSNIDHSKYNFSSETFIDMYVNLVKSPIATINYDGYSYKITIYKDAENKEVAFRETLVDSRNYLRDNKFSIRFPKSECDNYNLLETWI